MTQKLWFLSIKDHKQKSPERGFFVFSAIPSILTLPLFSLGTAHDFYPSMD